MCITSMDLYCMPCIDKMKELVDSLLIMCKLWKPRGAIYRTTPISACGGPAPHADVRSPRAETLLRMRGCLLRVRRPCPACGDPASHAGVSSPRAETLLRMRRYLLGVRRLCSACGGSVLTCGDLFFKPSQPSRFITPPVLIVASILAWLTFLRSLFSRDCEDCDCPACRVWLARLCPATIEPECVTIR